MGMIINTNVMAINAQRNLSITNIKLGRALEKLSSGLRINRAADDAAGLAISEKMRTQIRGMRQAARNGQDAISMVQIAEGALNEVHNILQRMRELTVQAGNDTLSTSDRTAIGEEMLTLRSEIDNIASRTTFNGLALLTGALSVNTSSTIADFVEAANADMVSYSIDVSGADAGVTYTLSDAGGGSVTLTKTVGGVQTAETESITGFSSGAVGDSEVINFDTLGVKLTLTLGTDGDASGADGTVLNTAIAADLAAEAIATTGVGSANFRVGAQTTDNITVAFEDMRSTAIGSGGSNDIGDLVTDNTSVDTIPLANTLLTALDDAITDVSRFRAKMGAAQNQVEAAVNSLGVVVENLSASESRIRDADIAEVSSELVARQIMQQAGVAVLAMANSSSQSVLALLQG